MVTSDPPPQPTYLTLTELTFNVALWGGVGYWIAGVSGACVGMAVIGARYAYRICVTASRLAMESSSDQTDRPPPDETPSTDH